MTPGEHAPDPRGARSPAEFLARLRALKDWSGLTYRALSARAEARGDVLPRSAVADMLSRTALPPEDLLAAFVRACGAGPDAPEEWRAVRRGLAEREGYGDEYEHGRGDRDGHRSDPDAVPEARPGGPPVWPGDLGAGAAPGGGGRPGVPTRIRRGLVVAVAVAALVLAGFSVVAFLRDGHGGHRPGTPAPPSTAPSTAPVPPVRPAEGVRETASRAGPSAPSPPPGPDRRGR